MIKVLWLSGTQLNSSSNFFYETWLSSMAKLLVESGKVELYNVIQGKVKTTVELTDSNIQEWVLPISKVNPNGEPSSFLIKEVERIMDYVRPDIVHIWGMEKNWGLLTPTGVLGKRVLLEIQGIKYTCSDVYYGGLNSKEILSTLRIQEIIFPNRFVSSVKRQFRQWGNHEKKMIKSHHHIGTQSDWVRSHIKLQNNDATTYSSKIALRKEFLNPEPWNSRYTGSDVVLMTSSSFAIPYKGVHVLLHSLRLLKDSYPQIKLKIAGEWTINKPFYRKSGYLKWFVSKAKELDVFDSLEFLGPLNASELLRQMYLSDIFITSSYVDTYNLALAEAMAVGIPCVASYVGGMKELGVDNESVLYFAAGDYFMCAANIDKVLSDKIFAMKLSKSAIERLSHESDYDMVLERQLKIYEEVINSD